MNAYLRTVAVILFLPWRAGRGLVVPDNWYRSARWAVGHLALATLAAALLANGQHFPRWIIARIWAPSFDPPHIYYPSDAPAERISIWFCQSLVAWTIVVVFPVGLGIVLSIIIPGRHRAAKLGGVKWSLYLSSLYTAVLTLWYGYYLLNPPRAEATFPMTFTYTLPTPDLAVVLMACVYGAWWAAGMAVNPYNRERGVHMFFIFAGPYAGLWGVATWVLFPTGPLGAML